MKHERVKCASLKPDPKNARKHSPRNLDAIKKSLERFGQQRPIVVDAKGVVIAGNGTLEAAKALGWEEIEVVRSTLKGSSATAYAIADNRTAELAEWDDDILAETLKALKVEDEALAAATGFDDLGDISADALPEKYTSICTSPIYEIRGKKPRVGELCDSSASDRLIEKINNENLPPEVAGFLRIAATRHIVFNYALIAEWYAHADRTTQSLMEDSALIIVDIKKAIELGYAKLNDEIVRMTSEDTNEKK